MKHQIYANGAAREWVQDGKRRSMDLKPLATYVKLHVSNDCVLQYEHSRVHHRCAVRIYFSDFGSSDVRPNYPRFFDNANKRRGLSVDDFTHECFSLSLDYHPIARLKLGLE